MWCWMVLKSATNCSTVASYGLGCSTPPGRVPEGGGLCCPCLAPPPAPGLPGGGLGPRAVSLFHVRPPLVAAFRLARPPARLSLRWRGIPGASTRPAPAWPCCLWWCARHVSLSCAPMIAAGSQGVKPQKRILWNPPRQGVRRPRGVRSRHRRPPRSDGVPGHRSGVGAPVAPVPWPRLVVDQGRGRPPRCGRAPGLPSGPQGSRVQPGEVEHSRPL